VRRREVQPCRCRSRPQTSAGTFLGPLSASAHGPPLLHQRLLHFDKEEVFRSDWICLSPPRRPSIRANTPDLQASSRLITSVSKARCVACLCSVADPLREYQAVTVSTCDCFVNSLQHCPKRADSVVSLTPPIVETSTSRSIERTQS
jgi:hypothetical protein